MSDSQIKVSRLVCSDLFIFSSPSAAEVVFALSWTLTLEYIAYTLALHGTFLNEGLESDSSPLTQLLKCQILRDVSCLQDWLSYPFFCRFWHNIVLFIQSLGFSLRESCQKFGQRSR